MTYLKMNQIGVGHLYEIPSLYSVSIEIFELIKNSKKILETV